MNRRSMLGLLGLGAVAGPSVAKEAVYATQPSMYIDQKGNIGSLISSGENPVSLLNEAREQYSKMTGDKSKWIEDYVSRELRDAINYGSQYNQIDPDIQSMKSFSQSAKIRMHVQRKAERRYEEYTMDLSGRIKHWMEQAGL